MQASTRRAISFTIPINRAPRPSRICASGREPIQAPYLIAEASFVACHQFSFLERQDMLRLAAPGATFLLNAPYDADEVWDHLPRPVQQRSSTKSSGFS